MSIESSLVKLADKIDADGKSTVSPEYKNPNNSIEKSIERIAENYSGSGGGGGGGGALIATLNMQTRALDKTWTEINDAGLAFVSINEVGMKITGLVALTTPMEDGYVVGAISFGENETGIVMLRFMAESADGYPVMAQ